MCSSSLTQTLNVHIVTAAPLPAYSAKPHPVEGDHCQPVAQVGPAAKHKKLSLHDLLWTQPVFLTLSVDSVTEPTYQNGCPHRQREEGDVVPHNLAPARRPPAAFVHGEYGKVLGRQQAGHVQGRVQGHEQHHHVFAQQAGVGRLHQPDQLDAAQDPQDVPQRAGPEKVDDGGGDEEGENAGDNGLVGHPQVVLVPPHGVVEPLAEVRLCPARLLVEPAQELSRRLCVAFRQGCVSKRKKILL